MTDEQVAYIAHETNRAYCKITGDYQLVPWGNAPEWQQESAIKGVRFARENPDATHADSHASWLAEKVATGWKYGPRKDEKRKEHHCMVPYEELPLAQRRKDALFLGIVRALTESE